MFIDRLSIVKVSVLHKLTYRLNAIPIKTPASYFVDIDKLVLKLIMRSKRPRITNSVLKKNKVRGLILPDFKSYYKSTVIKTIWFWQKKKKTNKSIKRYKEPRNRLTQK